MSTSEQTRFSLRWKKVWQTEDGRGCIQSYTPVFGGPMFDAYLDGQHLGHTRRRSVARRLVERAMAQS